MSINLRDLPVANFPDGHKHLIVTEAVPQDDTIRASLRSFDDLFLLAQAKQIYPHLTRLYVSYLLAARCDRRFSTGEAFDLGIVANFINTLQFEEVMVLKPHSAVAGVLINNMVEADLTPVLLNQCERENNLPHYGLVSPDKGASQWIQSHVKNPSGMLRSNVLIQCEKQRDMNAAHRGVGKIIVPDLPEGVNDYVIVDDLCDGGGTFIGIARDLRSRGAKRVFLVVTHAIFSKGLEPFQGLIDRIYCTNSFADFNSTLVYQENIQ